jgi:AraC family transcriptional regulator
MTTMHDALATRPFGDLDVTRRTPVRSISERREHESRVPLLQLSVGLVEDLSRECVRPGAGPEALCEEFQICLPYRGLFVWHVGREEVVGDPTQVLFVRGGEPYRMSAPTRGGYAELIITPDVHVLSQIAQASGTLLSQHPMFGRRARRAEPHLQSFLARFLHWARRASGREDLEAEELVLDLLRSTLQENGWRKRSTGTATARMIRRTKEFLEANLTRRLLLADIAAAVNASPAYLTDLFSRVEGVSLHQYVTQRRLGRALVELPHTADLTTLALDLGFSSHSHFSFVFRRAYGCSPSDFRQRTRRAARPSPLAEDNIRYLTNRADDVRRRVATRL